MQSWPWSRKQGRCTGPKKGHASRKALGPRQDLLHTIHIQRDVGEQSRTLKRPLKPCEGRRDVSVDRGRVNHTEAAELEYAVIRGIV